MDYYKEKTENSDPKMNAKVYFAGDPNTLQQIKEPSTDPWATPSKVALNLSQ